MHSKKDELGISNVRKRRWVDKPASTLSFCLSRCCVSQPGHIKSSMPINLCYAITKLTPISDVGIANIFMSRVVPVVERTNVTFVRCFFLWGPEGLWFESRLSQHLENNQCSSKILIEDVAYTHQYQRLECPPCSISQRECEYWQSRRISKKNVEYRIF